MKKEFTQKELITIQEKMTIFYKSTDILCIFIDEDGEVLLRLGKEEPYCCHFWEAVGSKGVCKSAHHYSGIQSFNIGDGYISFCPSGLVHFTAAITVGKVYRGALIAGPVHMDSTDPYVLSETFSNYNIDTHNQGYLKSFYQQIPVVSPERVRHLSRLLQIIANEIGVTERTDFEKKRKIYEEQNKLSESIQVAKGKKVVKYPVELEKELLRMVKAKDVIGAKKVLNDLLGHIFLIQGVGDQRILSMISQVATLLSRAAVESGASFEQVTGYIFEFEKQMSQESSIDEMLVAITELLDKMILATFPVQQESEYDLIIQKSIHYINNHFSTDITLEDAANHVNLSASYFSRFFKKQTGMNFSEYLNSTRIEHSKRFLWDTRFSLSDVALMVGFSDQSYFSKIFKKYESVTPGQFRKIGES